MAPKKKPKAKLSKSAKYYRDNPKSRKTKSATDKRVNSKPEQKKKRRESGKKRYDAKKKGKNIKDKDYDHKTNSFMKSSKNRGAKGEGGRKKKSINPKKSKK